MDIVLKLYQHTAVELPEGAKLLGEQKYIDGMRVNGYSTLTDLYGVSSLLPAILPNSRAEYLMARLNQAGLSWAVNTVGSSLRIVSTSWRDTDSEALDYAYRTNITQGTETHELLKLLLDTKQYGATNSVISQHLKHYGY